MSNAPTWQEVEEAIASWVKTATGLDDGHVILRAQGGGAPSGPYVAVGITGPTGIGLDVADQHFDGARPSGQEVELRVIGSRYITVNLRAFGTYGASSSGDSTGRAMLSKVQTGLSLPTIRDAINAAGLGVHDEGNVLDLSASYGADFEGQAALDVRFSLRQSLSDYVGYIATAVAAGAFDLPRVISIAPATGAPAGGTHVVIRVDRSATCTAAFVGGLALANFAIVDSTHVAGDTLAHAAGAVDVTVQNVVGVSAPLVGGFTYA